MLAYTKVPGLFCFKSSLLTSIRALLTFLSPLLSRRHPQWILMACSLEPFSASTRCPSPALSQWAKILPVLHVEFIFNTELLWTSQGTRMAASTQECQDISLSPFRQYTVSTKVEMKYYMTRSYFNTFALHRQCERGRCRVVLLISGFSESPAKAKRGPAHRQPGPAEPLLLASGRPLSCAQRLPSRSQKLF